MPLPRGLTPPSVVFRTYGAFSPELRPNGVEDPIPNPSPRKGGERSYLFCRIGEQAESLLKSRRDDRTQTGVQPPVIVRQRKKPRRGDREISKLILVLLHVLSPFQGFVLLMPLPRGLTPPSVVFRTYGAFSPELRPDGVEDPIPYPSPQRRKAPSQTHSLGEELGAAEDGPQGGVLRSTENRLTLRGESAYTPRSIGPRSTERRTPLSEAAKRRALRCPSDKGFCGFFRLPIRLSPAKDVPWARALRW